MTLNECPVYDAKLSDGEVPVLERWNIKYSFIAITPWTTLTGVVVSI